jgi:hypothetical protein
MPIPPHEAVPREGLGLAGEVRAMAKRMVAAEKVMKAAPPVVPPPLPPSDTLMIVMRQTMQFFQNKSQRSVRCTTIFCTTINSIIFPRCSTRKTTVY